MNANRKPDASFGMLTWNSVPFRFLIDFIINPIHGMELVAHAVRERMKKRNLTKAVLALPDDVRAQ